MTRKSSAIVFIEKASRLASVASKLLLKNSRLLWLSQSSRIDDADHRASEMQPESMFPLRLRR